MHLTTTTGDRLTYTCDGCGCRWGWGMVLEYKGARCPIHGTECLRQAAVITGSKPALLAWAQAELERQFGDVEGAREGTDADDIPF